MRGHARSESATGVPSRVGPDKMRHPLTHDTSLYSVLPHKRRTSGGDLPASAPSPPPPVSPPSAAAPLSSSSPPQSRAKRCAAHVLLESKNQQLKANIQRLRGARLTGPDPRFVDASFDEYAGLQKSCRELARALAYSSNPGWDSAATIPQAVDACDNITATSSSSSSCYNTSARETVEKLERLRIGDHANADADGEVDELEASLGGLRILDPVDGHSRQVNEAWLTTIREWRDFVQDLLSAHQTSVLNTFRAYRRNATPETTARFLQDASFRTEAISKMKDTTPWASAKGFRKTPTFWPRYERRCHRLDTLRNVLRDAGQSLQWAEGEFHNGDDEAHHGGAADRPVREYVVAPRGDAILEFANTGAPQDACHLSPPVLRFRVSSYMLAETSPYFARLFSRDRTGDFEPFFYPPNSPPNHPQSSARNETTSYQPPPPAPPPLPSFRTVVLPGGSEARLYSMPELERNQHDALAILLHAAHMQTDKVPRAVIFAQFVAIAEVCLRYECTSPLEVFVEHFWLPAWVHMAAAAALPGNNGRAPAQGDQQPSNEHRGDQDGLLLVSYVFGLRRLFTRMSKTAILNVVDKEELWARPWPRKLKERSVLPTRPKNRGISFLSNLAMLTRLVHLIGYGQYGMPNSLKYTMRVPALSKSISNHPVANQTTATTSRFYRHRQVLRLRGRPHSSPKRDHHFVQPGHHSLPPPTPPSPPQGDTRRSSLHRATNHADKTTFPSSRCPAPRAARKAATRAMQRT